MPSYSSVLPPDGTNVIVHFSHGVFNTMVLETASHELIPVGMLNAIVNLRDVTFVMDRIRTDNSQLENYYSTSAFQIPVIQAKINAREAARTRVSYRSSTLDAALRGQGRASMLLETMPNIVRRNPDATPVSRNSPRRNEGPMASPPDSAFQRNDTGYQWLPDAGMCQLNLMSGRLIGSSLDSIPSTLMVMPQHPQFLLHRPS